MTAPEQSTLTERERAILDFETEWPDSRKGKEIAVRNTFGLRYARYHQILNALLDGEASLLYDPMLVKRLIRARNARVTARKKAMQAKSSA